MKKLLASGAAGVGMLMLTAMPVAAVENFTATNNGTANNSVQLNLGTGANMQTALSSFVGEDTEMNSLTIGQTLVTGNISAVIDVMNHVNSYDASLFADVEDDVNVENTGEANTGVAVTASTSSNGQTTIGGFGDGDSDDVNDNTAAITQQLGTGTVGVAASLWNAINTSFMMTP